MLRAALLELDTLGAPMLCVLLDHEEKRMRPAEFERLISTEAVGGEQLQLLARLVSISSIDALRSFVRYARGKLSKESFRELVTLEDLSKRLSLTQKLSIPKTALGCVLTGFRLRDRTLLGCMKSSWMACSDKPSYDAESTAGSDMQAAYIDVLVRETGVLPLPHSEDNERAKLVVAAQWFQLHPSAPDRSLIGALAPISNRA